MAVPPPSVSDPELLILMAGVALTFWMVRVAPVLLLRMTFSVTLREFRKITGTPVMDTAVLITKSSPGNGNAFPLQFNASPQFEVPASPSQVTCEYKETEKRRINPENNTLFGTNHPIFMLCRVCKNALFFICSSKWARAIIKNYNTVNLTASGFYAKYGLTVIVQTISFN